MLTEDDVRRVVQEELSKGLPDYGGYGSRYDQRYFIRLVNADDNITFIHTGCIEIGQGKPGAIGNFRIYIKDGKLETQECTAIGWSNYTYHQRLG